MAVFITALLPAVSMGTSGLFSKEEYKVSMNISDYTLKSNLAFEMEV